MGNITKVTAIYCRQSIEKVDSISIETQIEKCQYRIPKDEKCEVYQDKGYTGSNTNRPEFKRLMNDVERGRISRVIVYKIDRISRSLLDFSGIIQTFVDNKVEFVSATENINLYGAMDRAMLNIIMVFAQLERETIQVRVRDNFYSRAKQGIFLAGRAPFGFEKIPYKIGNVNTNILKEKPTESKVVCHVYDEYLDGKSIGSITRELNDVNNEYNLGRKYTSTFIGRMLRNPVYVQSNAAVYMYFKSCKAILHNDIQEFNGNGCTVYGDRKKKTRGKFTDLSGENIQLNLHKGIIEPDKWLTVQKMLSKNKTLKNSGKGQNSWLSGLTKCKYCGLAVTVVNGQYNGKRYINCGGHKAGYCNSRTVHYTFNDIEDNVEAVLLKHIDEFEFSEAKRNTEYDIEIAKIQNEIDIRTNKINNYLDAIGEGEAGSSASLFKSRIEEQQDEIIRLNAELMELDMKRGDRIDVNLADIVKSNWGEMTLDDKKKIAHIFISKVIISNEGIEVQFKFN